MSSGGSRKAPMRLRPRIGVHQNGLVICGVQGGNHVQGIQLLLLELLLVCLNLLLQLYFVADDGGGSGRIWAGVMGHPTVVGTAGTGHQVGEDGNSLFLGFDERLHVGDLSEKFFCCHLVTPNSALTASMRADWLISFW